MNYTIYKSELKTEYVLNTHRKIAVSISGGYDSDVVLDLVKRYVKDQEVEYIFFDTGLEYKATHNHLDYLEKKYNITIKRYKPKKSIPIACKEFGQPFLSKYVSNMMSRLQKHNFDWSDEPLDVLLERYPKCKSGIKWWKNEQSQETTQFNIANNKWLKEFILENPPNFKISNKCCKYAKKDLSNEYIKENNPDLMIVGVRKAEGGIRAASYKTCFTEGTEVDYFYPILYYTDQDKIDYKEQHGLKNSDCYEVYGLKRTGCVGCPFGRSLVQELDVIKRFENRLYNATHHIFGESYKYTEKYRDFVEKMTKTKKED